MSIYLATKTLALIEKTIQDDQGASYRGWLARTIGEMGDAYSTSKFPYRSHMGASMIGDDCPRQIWYGFHWATRPHFGGRLLRLFNRGHLEEARFIAMLLAIGCDVYQQDENGNQFRISDAGGHFGGSGDGVAIGVPDVDSKTPVLLEFKTSAEKPFLKLEKLGVREAKFVHFIQMQVYMHKMALSVALYMCVNKNNDQLYGELIPYDRIIAEKYIERGVSLVWSEQPPKKINESAGWFGCRFCDHRPVCHLNAEPDKTCRSCVSGDPKPDGTWVCSNAGSINGVLDKDQQLAACSQYTRKF